MNGTVQNLNLEGTSYCAGRLYGIDLERHRPPRYKYGLSDSEIALFENWVSYLNRTFGVQQNDDPVVLGNGSAISWKDGTITPPLLKGYRHVEI